MFRKLLATTAVAALLTTGAMAADSTSDKTEGKPLFTYETEGSMTTDTGYFEAEADQILASELIGATVYAGIGEDAEAIGEVHDVIMGPDGLAEAIVIGVGGFLGIGEKDVAVDFERITWVDGDDDRRLLFSASKEDLEAAPEFDRTAFGAMNWETEKAAEAENAGPVADREEELAATGEAAEDMKADRLAADQSAGEMTDDGAAETGVDGSQTTAAIPDSGDAAAPDADFHAGWTVVEAGTFSAEELMGARVYGAGNADLGEIGDVIITADGKVEAYVVDVGGFLGIGEKPVALDAAELEVRRDESGNYRIVTRFTEEQLEGQVAYTKEAYEADRDAVVLR
jgi:sporulation protein YlmC with PRC-barrel domain